MALKIDSHHHFWDLSRNEFDYSWLSAPENEAICKTYLPDSLLNHIQNVGVDKTVLVQTQHTLLENDWALQLASQTDYIAGVVGWVDLAAADIEEQVLRYKDQDKFVGIRHITQDEPDDNFIVREQVLRGLGVLEKHNIPFDLLFYVKHLHHAQQLGQQFPNLPMVIDHLSKPEIKGQRLDNWEANLKAAAKFPSMMCKLSGMVTEADWQAWKPADLKPYIEIVLEAFGPERCMYGSDWPVCELAATYEQVHNALADTVGCLSKSELENIFGATANRFYRLGL
ncbi:MAG: amidohydrolase [Planctomycetaceae bacterium]|nr:amidohydrolase [Planctomycetaceae bacterium]|tara:strand:- start:24534 stop:25382 length:849 start_codon:yes stop_codon:yes gene_type:complete